MAQVLTKPLNPGSLPDLRFTLRSIISWRLIGLTGILIGLYVVVGTLAFSTPSGVFTSPDENVNYLIMKSFGETGKFYYQRDFLAQDEENYLHPRLMFTYNDRIANGRPIGLPLVYGTAYRILGENVRYAALLLAPLCLIFLYKTCELLFRSRSLIMALPIFGAGSLLYWFSIPFQSTLGSTTFFAGGIFFLVSYYYKSRNNHLMLGVLLFSLSMLFRYENIFFAPPLIFTIVAFKHGRSHIRQTARDVAVVIILVSILFVLPVLLANQATYGNPLTTGRNLIQGIGVSPDQTAMEELKLMLLPSGGVDPLLIAGNLVRFTIKLVPAFTILALAGLIYGLAKRPSRMWRSWPFALLIGYYVIYLGSASGTWLATTPEPTFAASMVRYWNLLYIPMFFAAAYFLVNLMPVVRVSWRKAPKNLTVGIPVVSAGILVVSTLPTLWFQWEGNWVRPLKDILRTEAAMGVWVENVIALETPENAIVYTAGHDKYISSVRDVATWESGFDPKKIASSMTRVLRANPVYVVDFDIDVGALREPLGNNGLFLRKVSRNLFKLESTNSPVSSPLFQSEGEHPYLKEVLINSPIHYWRLGESSYTDAAYDIVGGKDGTYIGNVALGAPGGIADNDAAAAFDGAGDYVKVGSVENFAGKAEFTVEFLVKFACTPANWTRLVSNEVIDADGRQGYSVFVHQPSGHITFDRIRDGYVNRVKSQQPVAINRWTHVAATYDGISMRFYIDGKMESRTTSSLELKDRAGTLEFGRQPSGREFLHGALDEIAIYDYPLDEVSINAHFMYIDHLGSAARDTECNAFTNLE